MRTLQALFENNRRWAAQVEADHPGFFEQLARQQAPRYLWIGCSDSRVPANEIVGLRPGELFVHRNVANLVGHTDLNCLSVLQYAVEVLRVSHIIVCGHYGCGGIAAATSGRANGLIDNWLGQVRDVRERHRDALECIADEPMRLRRLCEFNVIEQVRNTCRTPVVQEAWRKEQGLAVHGWVYDIRDGLLRDLETCVTGPGEIDAIRFPADRRGPTADGTAGPES